MGAPVDILEVDLTRRQGDVSGTLIYVAPNGQPANIGGWTFVFSVQPGASLIAVTWVPPVGNASGLPITTVGAGGFTIPGFNSTVSVPCTATAGFTAGDFIQIAGVGIVQVKTVTDGTHLLVYNSGFPGNSASGSILAGVNVFEASNVGYTVLVIPSTVTNWNAGNSKGRFQYYIKYDTTDPAPGPFKKTFYQGFLYITDQNDPTA
jgi:hypothetical protein